MKNLALILFLLLSLDASALTKSFTSGSGKAKGLFNVIMINAHALKKEIPKGLELIPELNMPNGDYPVVMFVGEQHDLKSRVGFKTIPLAEIYREATLTINVQSVKNKSQKYSFTSHIIVDNRAAQLLGWMMGYPKVMNLINSNNHSFIGKFKNGVVSLDLQIQKVPSYDRRKFEENFKNIIGLIPPSITETPAGFLCFDFIWNFDISKARPVRTSTYLANSFVGQDLAGLFQSPGLNESPMGSVYFEADWEIKNFQKCK